MFRLSSPEQMEVFENLSACKVCFVRNPPVHVILSLSQAYSFVSATH